jgi:hypothetical protein
MSIKEVTSRMVKTVAGFEPTCRLSRHGAYSMSDFNRMSCSYCFELLKYVFPDSEQAFSATLNGSLFYPNTNQLYDPTRNEHIQIVRDTMDAAEFDKWRSCCSEAELCCAEVMSLDNPESKLSLESL